jgi:phosphatidylserine decarboxylase
VGRFNMGSTVILLFAPDRVSLDAALAAGDAVRMGQPMGRLRGAQA